LRILSLLIFLEKTRQKDHMKIAFIIQHFPSLSQTFILNQITGLIDLGHKVDIFAFDAEMRK
jgi:hypothetical protein